MEQKFFLYARKSTDNEEMQVLSIESQLAELRELAKKENILVVNEFIEKQSAKIPGRPIFDELLKRIEKGEASGILAWHPDRLSRNSIDGGKILYLLDQGIIKSLKFPSFWFESTPQGKFMLSIAFGQSKYYVDALSENTKRGLRQKVRRGEMPGLAPIGYLNDRQTKTVFIDKQLSPVIIKCFEMYATGNSRLLDLANFLAENGVKTKTGKTEPTDWVSHIILSNPFYYGHFRYKGEVYEGTHEPIIAKKLFDQCQEILAKRSWKGRIITDTRIQKVFTGLFRCGECGMMITAERKTKYYKRKNHSVTYTYYRCTKKSKVHPNCTQKFIREEELDKQLSGLLQKVSWPQDEVESWKTGMLKLWEKDKTESILKSTVFVQEKREQIQNTNQKLKFVTDSYIDQILDRYDYLDQKNFLVSQKKTFEEQILTLEQKQNDWLGPLYIWIERASEVDNISKGNDLMSKKLLAQEIFGSDLFLKEQTARGEALGVWAALCAAPTGRDLERGARIELVSLPWEGSILPVY